MKKLLYAAIVLLLLASGVIKAQTVIPCITEESYRNSVKQFPELEQQRTILEQKIKNYIAHRNPPSGGSPGNSAISPSTKYIIPVVIHVVRDPADTTGTDIAFDRIDSQMVALNKAYLGTNIQFCLATKLPDGTSTWASGKAGVTKHISTASFFHDTQKGHDALTNVSYFPPQWYMNIWVVSSICADSNDCRGFKSKIVGLSPYPIDGNSTLDGVVVKDSVFGNKRNGGSYYMISNYDRGATLAHEAGHYLFLYHTFQGGCLHFGKKDTTACRDSGDYICDTPPIKQQSDCNVNALSCDGSQAALYGNPMDYGNDYCKTNFTFGQIQRMQAVLDSIRTDLISDYNLNRTGITCVPVPFVVDFDADLRQKCTNENVTFTTNTNGVKYKWHFPGGTPDSSNLQNPPTIHYSNPGSYDVSLTVADTANNTKTTTKKKYMFVSNCTPIQSDQGNWYFGYYAGISFASGKAKGILGNQIDGFGANAVASSKKGRLLFYTDGKQVFDSTNALVTNNLLGATSSYSVIIIPNPADSLQYYIFYTDHLPFGTNYNRRGLGYSIYDMRLRGGKGDIAPANKNLLVPGDHPYTAVGVTAIPHCNGTDYWVIVHGGQAPYLDKLLAYRVALDGIHEHVTSNSYLTDSVGFNGPPGLYPIMAVSPNGRKFIIGAPGGCLNCTLGPSYTNSLVYDFDKSTGLFTSIGMLNNNQIENYAFSPSSDLFYMATIQNSVVQYDLSRFSTCGLFPSKKVFDGNSNRSISLQCGPDNKIYVGQQFSNKVGVINYPDKLVTDKNSNSIGYNPDAVHLLGLGVARTAFPNMINALKQSTTPDSKFEYCIRNCYNVQFKNESVSCGSFFTWIYGDGSTSTGVENPFHTYSKAGSYIVVFSNGGVISQQTIVIHPPAAPTIVGPREACFNSISNYSTIKKDSIQYSWTFQNASPATSQNLSVDVAWQSAGAKQITLSATNTFTQCATTTSITVQVYTALTANAGSNAVYSCNSPTGTLGGSPTANGGKPPYTYNWEPKAFISGSATGANPTAQPTTTTTYTLTVTDALGCYATSSVLISLPNNVAKASFTATSTTCHYSNNGIARLYISGAPSYTYSFSTGVNGTTSASYVDFPGLGAGTYTATITDAVGCSASATTTISELSTIIYDAGTTYKSPDCLGPNTGAIYLKITGGTPPYHYLWTTGATTDTLQSAAAYTDYYVTVTDVNGCKGVTSRYNIASVINNAPSVTPGPVKTTCIGQQIALNPAQGSGGTPPYTYQWQTVGQSQILSGATTTTPTVVSKQSVDTFIVVLTDAHGCTASAGTYLKADLTAFAGLNQTTCPFTTVTIGGYPTDTTYVSYIFPYHGSYETAQGGKPPYTYQWAPDGSFQTATNIANPQVRPFTNRTYYVTVSDANGCTASAQTTVSVKTPIYYSDDPRNGLVNVHQTGQLYSPGSNVLLWNNLGTVNFQGVIEVNAGEVFTISGNTTVQFSPYQELPGDGVPSSGIVVAPGGILNVTNGAVLTYNPDCGQMWDGVQAWGNSNAGNGTINISGNAHIENARTGVSLFRTQLPFGGSQDVLGRGVIHADGAIFNHNRIDIQFFSPSLQHNASRIQNCTFLNNWSLVDHYSYPGNHITYGSYGNTHYVGNYAHIVLKNVYGVGIMGGNTFIGNSQNITTAFQFPLALQGIGVVSYDAGYDVAGYISVSIFQNSVLLPVPNNFRFLYKGIDAYSTGGTGYKIRIRQNNFAHLNKAIITNGTMLDEIVNNTIDTLEHYSNNSLLDSAGTNDVFSPRPYGVYTYGSLGYIATGNNFKTSGGSYGGSANYAFLARNASNGTIARVYNNNFPGNFYVATQFSRNDTALQMKCNNYSGNNSYDWAVTSGGLGPQGACNFNSSSPAGNIFGTCNNRTSDSQIHLNSGVKSFNYSSHQGLAPTCTTPSVNIITCPGVGGIYNQNISCPDSTPVYTPLPGPPPRVPPCALCPIIGKLPINAVIQKIQTTVDQVQRAVLTNQVVRTLLDSGNVQAVIQIIQQTGLLEDRKILVPTYLLQHNCDSAQRVLNSIPNTGVENDAYHQLFDMLVNVCRSGRAMVQLYPQEMNVVALVAASNARVSVNAQSLIATIKTLDYNRIPEAITPGIISTHRMGEQQEHQMKAAEPEPEGIRIIPNPTGGFTTLHYNYNNASAGYIDIYNMLGKQERHYQLTDSNGQISLNAYELATGMYFVRLTDNTGRLVTLQKMIVNY